MHVSEYQPMDTENLINCMFITDEIGMMSRIMCLKFPEGKHLLFDQVSCLYSVVAHKRNTLFIITQ